MVLDSFPIARRRGRSIPQFFLFPQGLFPSYFFSLPLACEEFDECQEGVKANFPKKNVICHEISRLSVSFWPPLSLTVFLSGLARSKSNIWRLVLKPASIQTRMKLQKRETSSSHVMSTFKIDIGFFYSHQFMVYWKLLEHVLERGKTRQCCFPRVGLHLTIERNGFSCTMKWPLSGYGITWHFCRDHSIFEQDIYSVKEWWQAMGSFSSGVVQIVV